LLRSTNNAHLIIARIDNNGPLKPGNYEISSVLTCTAQ
jgi:hypothetical protein